MKPILKMRRFETPLGEMQAVADDAFLYSLAFVDSKKGLDKADAIRKRLDVAQTPQGTTKILDRLDDELARYFQGKLHQFSIPIKLMGTEFQQDMWRCMQKLEFGQTKSYGELAAMSGRSSKCCRAVGAAAGANPIVILVPCHRVTAHNEQLGGFSCGLDRKKWLLKHENASNISY